MDITGIDGKMCLIHGKVHIGNVTGNSQIHANKKSHCAAIELYGSAGSGKTDSKGKVNESLMFGIKGEPNRNT